MSWLLELRPWGKEGSSFKPSGSLEASSAHPPGCLGPLATSATLGPTGWEALSLVSLCPGVTGVTDSASQGLPPPLMG